MSETFRFANTEDINDILAIEELSFADGVKESRVVYLDRISTFPEGFLLLEMTESTKPVGYICSELWTFAENLKPKKLELGHSIKDAHIPQGNELYISSMGLLPEFRGAGLGKKMLQELMERTIKSHPKVISVVLIVSEKWQAAQNTYKKLGFQEVFTISSFFKPIGFATEKGIVMRKKITQ
ncbi:GCN5-related N-acetyltransferase [Desulforamulus reducens MI-1]|uniref:GCN5-related N-acetyltransferase n=1 Tax=Desulforamulus reducens (strain ATCC BAA-1160 / DSM 100696 / MI-1) TaxID=349161 RepID=A4J4P7_DESRM|nr:N-acetyltransferase [Desulforamulus reducens]ABO50050.1 GCN5-related N-acetyltransferase [Desulforamulus reducens MI-1]